LTRERTWVGAAVMPNANYYREQARLLLRWAEIATSPATVQRLKARAQQMLGKAKHADTRADVQARALNDFNAAQMVGTRRDRAEQR
jgi:hypothetical protein